MNPILERTLHGSLVFLLIWITDRLLSGRMRAGNRRCWWLLVPLAFLVSAPLSVLPAALLSQLPHGGGPWEPMLRADIATQVATASLGANHGHAIRSLWIAGMAGYLLFVLIQTRAASLQWTRERLSTNSDLLELLEDCKQIAGITAPVGLVISDRSFAPAIYGFLRPRILLPRALLSVLSREQLRAILLHELAHLRSFDIPMNWLFTLVRAIHWFNPLSHLAFHAWAAFREEAADETTITWLSGSSPTAYGETLLCAIQASNEASAPFGAPAIGESLHQLKRRITMINRYPHKSSRFILTGAILFAIVASFILRPVRAEDTEDVRPAAVAAMETWLHEIDGNDYAKSWTDAAPSFQKALSSDKWVAALNSVRTPLGKCKERKKTSALHQTEIPGKTGSVTKGNFVIAQFDASFENLAYAIETVTFEKAPNGEWKASGYYIKPKL